MPRDTPPPIPKDVMDGWYARRRARWQARQAARDEAQGVEKGNTTEPDKSAEKKPKPVVESKTVYESAPQVRNLRQEAVTAFVPATVRAKMDKGKGKGGLMEPEEADRLERAGYLNTGAAAAQPSQADAKQVTMEEVEDEES